MKKHLTTLLASIVFIAAALSYGCIPSSPIDTPELSDVDTNLFTTNHPSLPDFTVLNIDGESTDLSDFWGKPIVINFWATWCGPCVMELPAFNDAYSKYGDTVTFLMVNLTDGVDETVDGVKSFVESNDYTFPIYYDTSFSAALAYEVSSIPLTLFIDKDGMLVRSQLGAMSKSKLFGYIESLLG